MQNPDALNGARGFIHLQAAPLLPLGRVTEQGQLLSYVLDFTIVRIRVCIHLMECRTIKSAMLILILCRRSVLKMRPILGEVRSADST